jgi:putative ABC transport system permease protein
MEKHIIINFIAMFKHYLKNTLRIISRRRVFSVINLIGLSIGLASIFLILLFVHNELSYNEHLEKKDQMYRVLFSSYVNFLEKTDIYDVTTAPLMEAIVEEYAEIKDGCRIQIVESFYIKYKNEYIPEKSKLATVDTSIFNMFSIPINSGNSGNMLKENSIVISENVAQKYFPNQNPIGQELEVLIQTNPQRFVVSAVIGKIPATSTFQADFLININYHSMMEDLTDWEKWCLETYILLDKDIDSHSMEDKFTSFIESHHEAKDSVKYILQEVTDIYLNEEFNTFSEVKVGNKSNVILFSIIALFILIVASLNYIILSISQSDMRIKEVAIRKVVGASKFNLIRQQFFEALIMVVISVPIALTLAEILLPSINQLFNKELDILYIKNWRFTLSFLGIVLVIAFISGSYIAFYLSKFEANDLLQKRFLFKSSKNYLSKGLIIIQLAIFVILFICSSVIREQIQYTSNKDLGFNKENLLNIDCSSISFINEYYVFKNEIEKIPGVINVSGGSTGIAAPMLDAFPIPNFKDPTNSEVVIGYMIEDNYLDVIHLQLMSGRNFDYRNKMDSNAVIFNESAVKKLEIEGDPVGQSFKGRKNEYKVIGVVKDFNFSSLRNNIIPVMLQLRPKDENINQVIIRIDSKNLKETVKKIEKTWEKVIPNLPIDYVFMNQSFDNYYKEDKRLGNVVNIFGILAIFIAALGLFGLSLLIVHNKVKIIGIHKVFGATTRNIINIIFKEYFILIVIANIIAWPLVYYFMNKWLDTFKFHISIEVMHFILAILVTSLIVFTTMGYISFKAANSNPSDSLRYE